MSGNKCGWAKPVSDRVGYLFRRGGTCVCFEKGVLCALLTLPVTEVLL